MGHSIRGIACFIYAICISENVDLLICIDGIYAMIYPNNAERVGKIIIFF